MCVPVACLSIVGFACPALADIVFGTGASGSEGIYVVDTDAVSTTLLFATPGILWYGATDGDDATSFFATPSGGSLYRIDVVGKTATAVGSYGGIAIKELAYNELSGILYGTDYVDLYQIDISSGTPTSIGLLNGPSALWAMDYDSAIDELVGVNQSDNSMYYIDMTTGSATLVGPTSQDRITDVWYDPISGGMFGVGNGPERLFSLNSSTAAATVLGPINENLLGMGRPVPEPVTLGLLALGAVATIGRRRR